MQNLKQLIFFYLYMCYIKASDEGSAQMAAKVQENTTPEQKKKFALEIFSEINESIDKLRYYIIEKCMMQMEGKDFKKNPAPLSELTAALTFDKRQDLIDYLREADQELFEQMQLELSARGATSESRLGKMFYIEPTAVTA